MWRPILQVPPGSPKCSTLQPTPCRASWRPFFPLLISLCWNLKRPNPDRKSAGIHRNMKIGNKPLIPVFLSKPATTHFQSYSSSKSQWKNGANLTHLYPMSMLHVGEWWSFSPLHSTIPPFSCCQEHGDTSPAPLPLLMPGRYPILPI